MFDNGPGEEVVEYRPPNDMEICDGQWHSIIIEKDGETGYLTVDRGSRHSVTSVFSNFLAVDTNHPLYIGGVPGEYCYSLYSVVQQLHVLHYSCRISSTTAYCRKWFF